MAVDEDLWRVACADAGYSEEALSLLSRPGSPVGGHFAVHLGPGDRPDEDIAERMGESFAAALDRHDLRGSHRIGVFETDSPHVQLGVLRHELEHARQFDIDGGRIVYRLHPLICRSLEGIYCGPSSATVYQEIPHEHDANAAATRLVKTHLEDPEAELLQSTHAPLFCTGPSPIDETPLELRAIAFASLHPDEFERACNGVGVRVRLVTDELDIDPGRWQALREDDVLTGLRVQSRMNAPERSRLEEADVAARRAMWGPTSAALRAGLERGVAVLRS